MEDLDIINTAIAATIPLLILYFGHRLDKRKREELDAKQKELQAKEDAKQAEQNKILRIHADHIQFELAAHYFGPQNGYYIVEIIMVLTNKGLVRKKLNELLLTIKGIEENTDIGVFLDLKYPINVADFPKPIVKTNVLEKKIREDDKEEYEKKEWFVEPGIVQKFSYVARIPEDIRFILVRSRFKYHKNSKHSAQKVFDLKLNESKSI